VISEEVFETLITEIDAGLAGEGRATGEAEETEGA
jgi:hypothetical protein